MFPRRYFAGRFFAPRYFPQSQGTPGGGGGSGIQTRITFAWTRTFTKP